MFIGYNLAIDDNYKQDFLKYKNEGKHHLENQKAAFINTIDMYTVNGAADGTRMEKDWFPTIDADIFISHSHDDEDLANGLSGWLYKNFDLKSFVDSCVWNHSDDLLEQINAKYSNKRRDTDGGYLYDHESCNVASKHVNTILSVSLQKMIDKTEAIILLNTPNSIAAYASVYDKATYSPWIYSEIVCTQIVRKKPLLEYRKTDTFMENIQEGVLINNIENDFRAAYEVSLDHLCPLKVDALFKWNQKYGNKDIEYPLDYLYNITLPEKMKKITAYRENTIVY